MQEQVIMNAELGVQLMKVTYRGEGMVLADSVRDALKWDDVYHMLRTLNEGTEYMKVSIESLKSGGCELTPNLALNRNKKGRPCKYAYLVTEQGMWKLITTRRPHDVKDDPELATWLYKFQNWVFGEVLPSVARTGAYMTDSVIEKVQSDPEYIYMMADTLLKERGRREIAEANAEQYRKERGLISSRREAQALNHASQLSKENKTLRNENNTLKDENSKLVLEVEITKPNSDRLIQWIDRIRTGRWGNRNDGSDQIELF